MWRPDRIGDHNRHHRPRRGENGELTYSAHWQDFYWQASETDSVDHQSGWWFAGNMHTSTRLPS